MPQKQIKQITCKIRSLYFISDRKACLYKLLDIIEKDLDEILTESRLPVSENMLMSSDYWLDQLIQYIRDSYGIDVEYVFTDKM